MGMDIMLNIVQDGEQIKENLFDGRNYNWFEKLQSNGCDEIDEFLPVHRGLPSQVPQDYKEMEESDERYIEFYYMNVKEFKIWFAQYRPDLDAGWITTYEKWLYETKNIIPELSHYLPTDAVIEDWHFIEVEDEYNNFLWLYNILTDENISDNADIVYYFY